MSLNFYLGEVTAQSVAAKQMASEYMQFCGTLKDSVNAFMNAPLSGKTYDSAKLYFSTVYPTLASGFILACEALIEAHSKFPEEFQSQVDTCDVIEDQLKAEIAQGQALLQSMARTMDKEKEPNQRLEQRYMGVQSSIQKNEEKLQRLYEFNASSPGLFADFEAQLANLDAGLAEVEKGVAWNSGSGTFDLGRMNMAWMKPISTRWKKREEMRQAKLKNGSTGKANTLADHGLTEADLVQVSDPPELVYQKYIKFAALGLNPHTGKPLTDKEKLQFQYAAHAGTMSDLIGLVGGAYAGQKASNTDFYKGSNTGNIETSKVGRWMSDVEYTNMRETGKVQMSPNGNRTYVAMPPSKEAFPSAPKGSLYAEFDVNSKSIYPAGNKNWGQIPGPGSLIDRLNQKKGLPPITEMPDAINIKKLGEK